MPECPRHTDPHDDRSITTDSLSLSFFLSLLCPTQSLRIYQLGFFINIPSNRFYINISRNSPAQDEVRSTKYTNPVTWPQPPNYHDPPRSISLPI
ncbi:hypothetical protein ACN38_g1363 [Penicillium nordicum]|uniref:Uncharacterized protein n=1 Tax=Penicillium nordicum TaxID=229535 RepID=A0A0M8PFN4_9EURO|nr:hypothetical protein ACN38_g1363 [Penicillium nordicum]